MLSERKQRAEDKKVIAQVIGRLFEIAENQLKLGPEKVKIALSEEALNLLRIHRGGGLDENEQRVFKSLPYFSSLPKGADINKLLEVQPEWVINRIKDAIALHQAPGSSLGDSVVAQTIMEAISKGFMESDMQKSFRSPSAKTTAANSFEIPIQ